MRRLATGMLLILIGATAAEAYLFLQRSAFERQPIALATCFSRLDNLRSRTDFNCLKNEVSRLTHIYGTRSISEYVDASGTPPIIRRNCHVIEHIIGQDTYAREGSLEKAILECSRSCRVGCEHGAIAAAVTAELDNVYSGDDVAHASLDALKKIGSKYCIKDSLCHGIGHLLYEASAGNMQKALLLCDSIAPLQNREYCYTGIFMEGMASDDSFGIREASAVSQNYDYPCSNVATPYLHACYWYLPLYQKQILDSKSVSEPDERLLEAKGVCEKAQQPGRAYCFEGMGSWLRHSFYISRDRVKAFCEDLAAVPDQLACLKGIAESATNL